MLAVITSLKCPVLKLYDRNKLGTMHCINIELISFNHNIKLFMLSIDNVSKRTIDKYNLKKCESTC